MLLKGFSKLNAHPSGDISSPVREEKFSFLHRRHVVSSLEERKLHSLQQPLWDFKDGFPWWLPFLYHQAVK